MSQKLSQLELDDAGLRLLARLLVAYLSDYNVSGDLSVIGGISVTESGEDPNSVSKKAGVSTTVSIDEGGAATVTLRFVQGIYVGTS